MILAHTDSIPSGTIKFRTMEHLNLDVHGAKWSLLQKLESELRDIHAKVFCIGTTSLFYAFSTGSKKGSIEVNGRNELN